jgi:hypothetical protein
VSGEKKEVSVIIKALDESVPGFKSARHHVKEFATEAKTLLAEAFAGFTVFEFFKTAIEKSTEAESAYVQLSNTLANVGVNYEHNRAKIDETIKSLQKVANVRTDEAIKGFNTLVQRSGDYSGSLKNMTLVADLAKAKHLEFNEAAELVGRVMGGNTRVLKQFGIVTKDAADGIQQLRERLHGAAEADLATFGGRVTWVKNRFFDFAEAIGDVITGNSSLGGSLKTLGDWLIHLTEYVEKNQAEFGFWFTVIAVGVKESVRGLIDMTKAAFYAGQAIGFSSEAVASLLKGKTGEAAEFGRKSKAAMVSMSASLEDLWKGTDRFMVAVGQAATKEAEGIKRSDAELAAAADRNRARLDKRAADAEAARQKERDAAEQHRNKLIDDQLTRLGKAASLREFQDRKFREQAIAGLNLMESLARRELAGIDNTSEGLRRRLILEDRLAKIIEEKKKAGVSTEKPLDFLGAKPPSGKGMIDDVFKADIGTANDMLLKIREQVKGFKVDMGAIPRLTFADQLVTSIDNVQKSLAAGRTATQRLGDALADVVRGPVSAFGAGISAAMAGFVTGSQTAGAAFRQSMGNALASIAKMEGDYFAARALGGFAKALGGNPLGLAEASQYGLAAAAMYAVSGLAAGAASGRGSGMGGSSASSNAAQANLQGAWQGSLTVVLNGKRAIIDAGSAADQDGFIAMLRKIAGNRQIDFIVNANAGG